MLNHRIRGLLFHKKKYILSGNWLLFFGKSIQRHPDRLRVDGRPKRIKKFAFTNVFVYNRLRVDGAYGVLRPRILLVLLTLYGKMT